MHYQEGARVFTADGREVGPIDRMVIDPETKEVTAVIVRKGPLFSEDKVIPVSQLALIGEDRVVLRDDISDLDRLPRYEEAHYLLAEDAARPGYPTLLYWYPPYRAEDVTWWGFPNYLGYPSYPVVPEHCIPENHVALREGARVIDSEGEPVGEVKRVMMDELADRVTHILISDGDQEQKLVLITWVRDITEDEVRLRVPSQFLHHLHPVMS